MFESKVFLKNSTWDPNKLKSFLAIPADALTDLPSIPGWFDEIKSVEETAIRRTEGVFVDITAIESQGKTSKKAVSNADTVLEHRSCSLLTSLKTNRKYKSFSDLNEINDFPCTEQLKRFSSLPNIHFAVESLCISNKTMEKDLDHTYTIEYKCMKENLKPVSSDGGLSENQMSKLVGIHSGITLDVISKNLSKIYEPKSNFELVLNKRSTTSGIELEVSRSECHADKILSAKSKELVNSQNSALAVDLNADPVLSMNHSNNMSNESSTLTADKQKIGFDVTREPSILSQPIPCGQPIPNANTTIMSCESDNNEEQQAVKNSNKVVTSVGADTLNAEQEKVQPSKKRKHTREKSKTSSSKNARKADILFSFDELRSILDTTKLCFEYLDS